MLLQCRSPNPPERLHALAESGISRTDVVVSPADPEPDLLQCARDGGFLRSALYYKSVSFEFPLRLAGHPLGRGHQLEEAGALGMGLDGDLKSDFGPVHL